MFRNQTAGKMADHLAIFAVDHNSLLILSLKDAAQWPVCKIYLQRN